MTLYVPMPAEWFGAFRSLFPCLEHLVLALFQSRCICFVFFSGLLRDLQ